MRRFIRRFLKCTLMLTVVFIATALLILHVFLSTIDGKVYTSFNFIYYYLLTPSILKNAPKLSEEVLYLSKGDDNYGFTRNEVTWKGVGNIMVAKEKLEKFLAENSIVEGEVNKIGEEYSIVLDGDDISLELISSTTN